MISWNVAEACTYLLTSWLGIAACAVHCSSNRHVSCCKRASFDEAGEQEMFGDGATAGKRSTPMRTLTSATVRF